MNSSKQRFWEAVINTFALSIHTSAFVYRYTYHPYLLAYKLYFLQYFKADSDE